MRRSLLFDNRCGSNFLKFLMLLFRRLDIFVFFNCCYLSGLLVC
jgi:hypothetical protein